MPDLTAGVTFVDGGSVTGPSLNAAFGGAVIQKEFVTGKSTIIPVGADQICFYDASGAVLGKCTLTALITALIGLSGTTVAAGNDSRFPAPIAGIRLAAGAAGADTAAKPKDFASAPTAAGNSGTAITLDCATNNFFTVTLTGNATITLSNISDGDKIRVRVTQDATGSRTLAWTTTQTKEYVAGSAPVVTATANGVDLFYFERCGNKVLVYARQALA